MKLYKVTILLLITVLSALSIQAQAQESIEPAKIYLYRPKSPIGMTVVYAVFINDHQVGVAKNGFNQVFEISEAGPIEIWGETEKKLSIKLEVEPGKEYYVKCGVKMGALTGRPKFTLMEERKGKQAYNKLI